MVYKLIKNIYILMYENFIDLSSNATPVYNMVAEKHGPLNLVFKQMDVFTNRIICSIIVQSPIFHVSEQCGRTAIVDHRWI